MEVDWRDSVVKPFNEQLANSSPFNPRSAQDASLESAFSNASLNRMAYWIPSTSRT